MATVDDIIADATSSDDDADAGSAHVDTTALAGLVGGDIDLEAMLRDDDSDTDANGHAGGGAAGAVGVAAAVAGVQAAPGGGKGTRHGDHGHHHHHHHGHKYDAGSADISDVLALIAQDDDDDDDDDDLLGVGNDEVRCAWRAWRVAYPGVPRCERLGVASTPAHSVCSLLCVRPLCRVVSTIC